MSRCNYIVYYYLVFFFFFSSRRRHTRLTCDWSSDVCSSDLTRAAEASRPGAPILWEERASNVNIDADLGDAGATQAAFARAAHVVRLETRVQRVTGVPMEPRAALAAYDPAAKRYTLYAGSGGVVRQKRELAWILGVDEGAVRVVARDTGGNFGTRNSFFPEFALVAWAARRLGRPVKWTCERGEAFRSDYQGSGLP